MHPPVLVWQEASSYMGKKWPEKSLKMFKKSPTFSAKLITIFNVKLSKRKESTPEYIIKIDRRINKIQSCTITQAHDKVYV